MFLNSDTKEKNISLFSLHSSLAQRPILNKSKKKLKFLSTPPSETFNYTLDTLRFLVYFYIWINFTYENTCANVSDCSAYYTKRTTEQCHVPEVKWRLKQSVHSGEEKQKKNGSKKSMASHRIPSLTLFWRRNSKKSKCTRRWRWTLLTENWSIAIDSPRRSAKSKCKQLWRKRRRSSGSRIPAAWNRRPAL